MRRRFGKEERGISPVVGSILLVAIVIMLVAMLAAYVSRTTSSIAGPSVTLSVEASENKENSLYINLTIIHKGGDSLLENALIVYAEDENGNLENISVVWPVPFTVGKEAKGSYLYGVTSPKVGREITVRIVHSPSSQLLFDGKVYVKKR